MWRALSTGRFPLHPCADDRHRTLVGCVGGSTKLDRAIAAFAVAYAEQSTRDYRRFVASLRKAHRSPDQV